MIKGFAIRVMLSVAVLLASACAQDALQPTGRSITLVEAVESTLNHHPLIKIQQAQVDISRGVKTQATGLFDFTVQSAWARSRVNDPLTLAQQQQSGPINNDLSNINTYTIKGSQVFRNGIVISPELSLNRTADNLLSLTGTNTSSLSLLVSIPLLQGRGRKATGAQERAAIKELDATLLDETQLAAQLMAGTANSYWNLVAAYKSLAIATESEKRGQTYHDNVQALINADAVPRNDLNEVAANLAQRTAARIAAQQQVIAAQQQLSLDMGIDVTGMFVGAAPSDDFPEGEGQQLPPDDALALQAYLDNALLNRGDYLAAQERRSESGVLENAAQNHLLPQLNLNLAAGYVGLREGQDFSNFFAPAYSGTRGPNTSIGITYTFPAGNNAARGLLVQSQAATRQADLHSADVARNIAASIVTAVSAVRNSLLQVKKARESVEAFRAALAGEQEKYRVGTGSVVDVLAVEDRLTNSLLNQVQAELAYAQAITLFRFATGTLISPDKPLQTVPPETFRSLPRLEIASERR